MKIVWTVFASHELKKIYKFYAKKAGPIIAKKIRSEIFSTTKQLIQFPLSGPTELSLETIGEGHRYLVIRNYKIIYKKVKEGILITDIFDTRQDPLKINQEERND